MPRTRRVKSNHSCLIENEPTPIEEPNRIQKEQNKEKVNDIKEIDDFELFEDKGVNTKIIAQKKKEISKPTKTQVKVQKEALKILETGKIPKTKNSEKKSKINDIWKVKETNQVDLQHLQAPKIDPVNPMWHPKRKFVTKLTKNTQYKVNGVIGPMKAKKMAMGKKVKK